MKRTTPCAVLLAFALSGCSLLPGSLRGGESDGGPKGGGKGGAEQSPSGGGFVHEGYSGSWGDYKQFRVEVTEVARVGERTRTTVEVTNLAKGAPQDLDNGNVLSPRWFVLLDTVNQRRYTPYAGTVLPAEEVYLPGVTYELVLYSARVEEDVETITVQSPGALGEFAGVPVVDGKPEKYPSPKSEEFLKATRPGDRATLPVSEAEPEPDHKDYTELSGLVESVVQDRETTSERETVALSTDVLFDFDKAELTPDAKSALDDVIAETRERADPDKPPITITGHTDGVGTDSYNQDLSERRAKAVEKVLAEELGSDYRYETEGKGSSEPAAIEMGDNDTKSQAENRRVELSYLFKEEVQSETAGDEKTKDTITRPDPGEVGAPAGFHSRRDLEPVAEGTARNKVRDETRDWRLRVYPFYRDGAFIVGRFDLSHEGAEMPGRLNPFGDYYGGMEFTAIDPAGGTLYREVIIGDPESSILTLGAAKWPSATKQGEVQYGHFYLPAPPSDVTSLTFDGGEFGKFEDVPIEK